MQQMAALMQRLPKAQLHKIQALMQKAMSGKDVTQEAQELERAMPPELLQQMSAFAPGLMGGMPPEFQAQMAAAEGGNETMDAAEARQVIEDAVKEGRLTRAEADAALSAQGAGGAEEPAKTGRWSKLMKSFKK